MPSASRTTTPIALDLELIEGRYVELGDQTVAFETYRQDLDAAPFFRGLPDDRCQCTHHGYVTAGQLTLRWADREETYVEGEAYVAEPGHTPQLTAGSSVVEFTSTTELAATMEVVGRNVEQILGATTSAG